MEYTKIKGKVIDLEQVLYYEPNDYNNQHFIDLHFKKNSKDIRIVFESRLERNFYLKELNDHIVECDIDQDFKDKFEIDIDEI